MTAPQSGPQWKVIAGVGAVAVAIVVIVVVALGAGSPSIGKQNCSQLADTYRDITNVLANPNNHDFDEMSKATKDATTMNNRIDELGGCLDEPSLQD